LASADAEFHNPAIQLSAHFGVAKDGTIIQWVDTDHIAFAQKNGNWPPIAYISTEFEGFDTEPLTDLQIQSGARIAAWCSVQHGFPLHLVDHGQPGLTTHCHYPSFASDPDWGNHSCPGPIRGAQLPQIAFVAALSLQQPPQPNPTPKNLPLWYPPISPVNMCLTASGKGAWLLGADGSVWTYGDAPYCGGANQHRSGSASPWFGDRVACAIELPDAAGQAAGYQYLIVATTGEKYGFPAK
jgi:hypothetical protein